MLMIEKREKLKGEKKKFRNHYNRRKTKRHGEIFYSKE